MKRHASMNRIYRLVWNATTGLLVVVAENAKGRGKSTSGRKLIAAALALSGGLFLTPLAMAGPVGGQISAGAGAISQTGVNTTITQTSQNMAINWQSFGIAANESVRFNQPGATSIALNRILGQSPSQIFGSLSANGQVFLLNPNGVLFAPGSQVNVGGLVASTLGLSDADFMAGKFSFSKGSAAGSVVNQGTLTAAQGGYIALLAPEVRNEGVISATMGTALLAAGDKVSINLSNGSLLSFNIDKGAINALADNKQLVQADGGQVFMSAKAADALSMAVVNNSGIVEARTVQNVAGTIRLMSDMSIGTVNVGGTLDASAANGGNGGFIETSAAHVKIADSARITTAAPNGKNGTWLIDPIDFTIAASGGDMTGAQLALALDPVTGGNVTIMSTSGTVGGTSGDVNVNDVVTWVDTQLTLNAQNNININSLMNGSGTAKLVLQFGQGALALHNSSKYTLGAAGQVWLNAGQNLTTILGSDLVTTNYTVINAVGAAGSVTGTDLQGMSLAGNYVLGGTVDATVTSTWNAGLGFSPIGTTANPFTGTFDGLGHSILNLVIKRPLVSQVGLFGATGASAAVRNIGLSAGSVSGLSEVGGLIGVNNGTLENSFSTGSVSSGVATGSYAGGLVGKNYGSISKSYATGGVVAAGNYAGGLVGANYGSIDTAYATGAISGAGMVGGLVGGNLNGLVNNSYATGAVTSMGNAVGGLVGLNKSSIDNSYTTGAVSGASYVGGLAGQNYGSVTNSYATAAVTATTSIAGGLVGENNGGSIANSYATGAVTSVGDNVGGLVGSNLVGSAISNSYATGNVSGGFNVGGLLGKNSGTVANSYASGAVSGSNYVGGLVGSNYGTTAVVNTGVINTSYATGSVTGTLDVGGLVGDNNKGAITNAYATGLVTGTTAGGFAGINSGTISNSFWDTTTSGQLTSAGGVGMATADMHTAANFTSATVANGSVNPGWDLTNTWIGYDGFTSPLLRSFMTALTVTANSATKTYDATAYSGGNGVTYSVTPNGNLLGSISYSGTSQGAINAGSYAITPGGLYSNQQGYIVSYATGTLTVTPAFLTLGSLTVVNTLANDKVYDGTRTAILTGGSLVGVVSGDVVTLNQSGLFASKNVGNNIAVTATDTLSGASAANYALIEPTGLTANITPKVVAVAASGVNKVYDGSINAVATLSSLGVIAGDAVSFANTTATFADKNVATGKAVSISGITATGVDAGNYTFNSTAATTADISAKSITVAAVGVSRVYDATVNATANLSSADVIAGDTVTFANTAATFADKNVGAGKSVSVSGISATGADAGNYALNNGTASTTADITPKALTVSGVTVSDKVYDGSKSATVNTTSAVYIGLIANDVVTANVTGLFSDKNVANVKSVTLTSSFTGADAGNYNIAQISGLTANITPATLAVSATGVNKVYDGLMGATVTYGDNRIAGDVLTFTGSASFADKNVATGKAVSVSGIAATGVDSANYTFNTTAATTANITAATLAVSATGVNKVYDGLMGATATLGDNRIAGDVLTLAGNASFADKNVATGKALSVSGITVTGTDAGNYTFNTTAATTANITAATLAVSATGVNKVYDGLTGATVTYGDNRIAGDVLTFTGSASFADKNVATSKVVSVSGIAATGVDSANYTFNTTAATTANITARALTVSATGVNKVYDGLMGATATLGDNRIAGVVLTLVGSASFADKNVATSKVVSVSGIAATGVDSANYTFNTTAATTADITPANLAVTGITANNKVYDGSAAATLAGTAVVSAFGADVVTVSGVGAGVFADSNVANGKLVIISGYTFGGIDMGNYYMLQPQGVIANIWASAATPVSSSVSATLSQLFTPDAIKPATLPAATTGSSPANNSPAVLLFGNTNSQNVSVISPIMSVLGVGLQMPGGVTMSTYSNE